MGVVSETYDWYKGNERALKSKGVKFELKRAKTYHDVTALPQQFECRGNELQIYLWDAGHLNFELFLAAEVKFESKYFFVESGSAAIALIESELNRLVELPPGNPVKRRTE